MDTSTPPARPAPQYRCWSCGKDCQFDLRDIQKERLDKKMTEVKPTTVGEPKKYFVRCPHCAKWNSVKI